MIKILKDTFKITNDSIITAIPLIIFLLLIAVYVDYAHFAAKTTVSILIAFLTLIFMVSAIASGWFYMVKKAVKLSKKEFVMDEDRAKAVMNLFRQIYSGIGKYFLSFLSFSFLWLILIFIMTNILGLIGIFTIGIPDIDPALLKNVGSTVAEHRAFLNSLTDSQLMSLFNWELLLYLGFSLLFYLCFLWVPEIIYGTKNAFKALFKSIKKVIKKPLKSFIIFLIFVGLHFVLSILSAFAQISPITYLTVFIVNFYFLIYSIILVFNYYEIEFVEN